jgi:probable rRNA maturation factor
MRKTAHTIAIRMKRFRGCPVKRTWIGQTILAVLEAEKVSATLEIDCLITDDTGIRALNSRYRGIDEPTDVLSFALDESGSGDSAFPEAPGETSRMGILVISFPTALTQAERNGVSVEEELRLLLVHGTLHILGYDHTGRSDGSVMRSREKQILSLLASRNSKF